MVVAHNPGTEQAAMALLRDGLKRKERDHADQMEEKFPTAALAVIALTPEQWKDVQPGGGRIAQLILPKQLD